VNDFTRGSTTCTSRNCNYKNKVFNVIDYGIKSLGLAVKSCYCLRRKGNVNLVDTFLKVLA
jgi:hypothetical protein